MSQHGPGEYAKFLQEGRCHSPHDYLGLHKTSDGQKIIRLWAPGSTELSFEFLGRIVSANATDNYGVFNYLVPEATSKIDYRVYYPNGELGHDPYAFIPTVSPKDCRLFNRGNHLEIYNVLGSHLVEHEGVRGVKFSVWAPRAVKVSLVGDFNYWRESCHPMRRIAESGIWEIFIPGISKGVKYKYAIKGRDGCVNLKSDPYGNQFELRPQTASMVCRTDNFCFRDYEWVSGRAKKNVLDGPINIYEMHLGSWMRDKEGRINYRTIASKIVPYMKDMGYTHLEILPITEYPLDESWGYQVTGYYAPTSRYGSLDDFQYFVNHLHMHQIGVILDWAPGHFPKDSFSLTEFDGLPLYEGDDPEMSSHPEWTTNLFDYSKSQVVNFLIGSALFWLDKMHIDGIRVDAVQSMIFLDYGRKPGEWKPNKFGGNENLDAIDFLQKLNNAVHNKFPGVIMIAEDASIREGLTRPVEWNGLGFDLKWNIGWANDTMKFVQHDPIYRKHNNEQLLRGYREIFRERYLLPVSHDEVVYEKKSLFSKMPLDDWHKFAHTRLYYGMSICHPGKKLFFMGCEVGQKDEWNCKDEVHWHLLKSDENVMLKRFVKDINHIYLSNGALWEMDFDEKGFLWIDYEDYDHSVISYVRKGVDNNALVCVHNFTGAKFDEYDIRLDGVTNVCELINSDDKQYGGFGMVNDAPDILPDQSGFRVKMPPLSTMIFKVDKVFI